MTAISMPVVDKGTVDELRKKMPDLSEMDLPDLKNAGRSAEEAIDRLLGRKKASIWPWVAAVIGIAAAVSIIGAYLAWLRRSATSPVNDTWTTEQTAGDTWASDSIVSDATAVNEEI